MFSIVTPTYNRAHTLPRVYNSLIDQTFKDFKWIIVDDGSTDTTKMLVEEWIKTSVIKIEYHLLSENQGKPAAVNHGLSRCDRQFTIIADSDDSFSSNTLQDLLSIWNVIDLTNNNICAIWTLVKDEANNIKGDLFPKAYWQVNFKQRILDVEDKLMGDKWHCWRTDILKNQKLYSNEKCHIQESLTWNDINKNHDFLCLNMAFLTAYYTEDSLINTVKPRKELAITYYYGSYYGLRDIAPIEILSNKYYRYLGFEYIKSKLYFSDKTLKLSFSKLLICSLIFISRIPQKIISQLK